jgi:protein-S-isoprenylcysteine O-methyltransferase Ste14
MKRRWVGWVVGSVGTAAVVLLARPTPLGVTVGFAIAALGGAIRVWASGHLLRTAELVTSGPYRFTRHPLNLGWLLIFAGFCVMARLPLAANWMILALGVVAFFGSYLPRKERAEIERLRAMYGEAFERYYRAVPALVPTLNPYPEGVSSGWSSDRMLRNREHWIVALLVVVSLVLLWRAYAIEDPIAPESPPQTGSRPAPS